MQKIWVIGTFDVENYGDVLFPHIARHRLQQHVEVEFASPLRNDDLWPDCLPTHSISELIANTQSQIDGILLGGGHVLHNTTGDFLPYNKNFASLTHAYPDIWFGSAYLAAQHNCPLLFNAPGVTPTLKQSPYLDYCQTALSLSEYINSRNPSGAKILQEVLPESEVRVVPDTAIEVKNIWSQAALDQAFQKAFESRGQALPERTLAIHLRNKNIPKDCEPVSQRLDELAEQLNAVPIVMSFGRCHSDQVAVRRVTQKMQCQHLALPAPRSLQEVTACLANSLAYIGSSFHGCIVASAFGRPCQLVVTHPQSKHEEVEEILVAAMSPIKSWLDIDAKAFANGLDTIKAGIRPEAFARVEQHWNHMLNLLNEPLQNNKTLKMQSFQASQLHGSETAGLNFEHYQQLMERLKIENMRRLILQNVHLMSELDHCRAMLQAQQNRNGKT